MDGTWGHLEDIWWHFRGTQNALGPPEDPSWRLVGDSMEIKIPTENRCAAPAEIIVLLRKNQGFEDLEGTSEALGEHLTSNWKHLEGI